MRYLMLAATATALFFAAYWLLMRREKRHTMVRFYLIGTLLLSFLLPAIHLRLAVPQHYVGETAVAAIPIAQNIPSNLSDQNNQNTPGSLNDQNTQPSITLGQVLFWLWLAGCTAAFTLLVVRLLKLRRRLCSLSYSEVDGLRLTLLDNDIPAFSFGRHIVVGTRDFSETEVQQLIGHEAVHVRQGHTADLLLCEVAKAVLWFDPFVYLYARELKRVHEYIADSEMMSADYAELFYHQVSGQPYSKLANCFDYGMVHQRIAMMARRRSHYGWLKLLAALPIVTAVLLAACTPKSSPLVGQWEYVSGTTEHIYHGGSSYPDFTADMGEEHLLDELDFQADGTATVMAWNNTTVNSKFVYEPCAIEWQVVGDSLLLRNERGVEAWHIQQLDKDTLVFVYSDIFTYYGGDGHTRNTYTYRRKK